MTSRIVSTKTELEAAKDNGIDEIIVIGELADNMHKAKNIAYASAGTIAALTAALAAIPFTGGLSSVGLVPIAIMSGFEVAAIIGAIAIGLGLLIAIFKDYEEIEVSSGRLVLKKKKG